MTNLREAMRAAISDSEIRNLTCDGYRELWLEDAYLNYAQRLGTTTQNMAAMSLHTSTCQDPTCHALSRKYTEELKSATDTDQVKAIIANVREFTGIPEKPIEVDIQKAA